MGALDQVGKFVVPQQFRSGSISEAITQKLIFLEEIGKFAVEGQAAAK
jgi:hypothetical protein